MSRGRRYSGEKKLNIKKVFAVIIAILVIIMFIFGIKTLLSKDKGEKITNEGYYTILENGKYGVINLKGEKIIEPSYAEYIVIPNHKKDIFICIYDVDYANQTYKTKALNAKNEQVYSEYEQIEALDNYDINQNVFYEQNALRIKKDGKYGLMNMDGKQILDYSYDKIETLKKVQNSILVEKDGKVGLVDSNGKLVVEPTYLSMQELGEDYKLGYIVQKEDKKYGIIDCNNNIVIEPKYEEIKPISENNLYVVKESGKWKVINKDGSTAVENKFDDIKAISGNHMIIKKGNQYGIMSTSGEEILKAKYEDINFAFTDQFIFKDSNKYGLVNLSGNIVLKAEYTNLTYQKPANFLVGSKDRMASDLINQDLEIKLTGIVSEINTEKGYLRIRIDDDYKYYNFKFEEKKNTELLATNTLFLSKKDGKYGFVDKNGKVVVEYQYDDATEQNLYGYAAINKDGKWGSIDKSGKVVQDPTYDLSNNLKIDFISSWHLGEDLNMSFYTK